MLVRFDSAEEDWIKIIDMKSDYPIQTSRHTIKHYGFNPSNARIISRAKGRIKKTKRTIRREQEYQINEVQKL